MIRGKDIRGREVQLPANLAAIEILSADGKLGHVLMFTKDGLALLGPGDGEFQTYRRVAGMETAEVIAID
jgi:hypothetical protein